MIVGLIGVGGGSLMTPLLALMFGVHPATAVGTDLLYAAATKSVDWRIVGRLALGSVPATLLTFLVMNALGCTPARAACWRCCGG